MILNFVLTGVDDCFGSLVRVQANYECLLVIVEKILCSLFVVLEETFFF